MKSRKMYLACMLGVLLIGLFLWEGNLVVKGGDNRASNEKRLEDTYRTRPLSLKDSQLQYDCVDEDGLSSSKWCESQKELEEETGFTCLRSRFFSDENSKIVYVKDVGFSEVYRVPKDAVVKTSVYGFLEKIETQPYLKMTVVTDAATEGVPEEYMGYYRTKEPFQTKSGLSVNLIEEYNDSAGGERYIIVFNHRNVVYTVENLESQEMAKQVADSFVER